MLYNVSLYYQKHGFLARVAYNSQSKSLISVSSNARADTWSSDRYFIDAQISYKVHKNFTVYANWQNITNQGRERYVFEDPRRFREILSFGSNVRAGIRFHF